MKNKEENNNKISAYFHSHILNHINNNETKHHIGSDTVMFGTVDTQFLYNKMNFGKICQLLWVLAIGKRFICTSETKIQITTNCPIFLFVSIFLTFVPFLSLSLSDIYLNIVIGKTHRKKMIKSSWTPCPGQIIILLSIEIDQQGSNRVMIQQKMAGKTNSDSQIPHGRDDE